MTATFEIIAFTVSAFIAIVGALGMTTTMSMFRSGIFLMASFIGVAGTTHWQDRAGREQLPILGMEYALAPVRHLLSRYRENLPPASGISMTRKAPRRGAAGGKKCWSQQR